MSLEIKHSELRSLWNDIKECTLCERNDIKAFVRGNPNARILFVGANPGRTEMTEGKALVGDAGKKLDAMCADVGIDTDLCLFSNAIFCGSQGTSVITIENIIKCYRFAKRVVEIVDPILTICLGKQAVQSMTSHDRPTPCWRKYVRDEEDRIYYCMKHPAYYLYRRGEEDFDMFRSLSEAWELYKYLADVKKRGVSMEEAGVGTIGMPWDVEYLVTPF